MTAPSGNHQSTAFVVDDDLLLRMDMGDMLEAVGFRLVEAADGDDAISVLERHHFDLTLLFSDVDMPGSREGVSLAREVAQERFAMITGRQIREGRGLAGLRRHRFVAVAKVITTGKSAEVEASGDEADLDEQQVHAVRRSFERASS